VPGTSNIFVAPLETTLKKAAKFPVAEVSKLTVTVLRNFLGIVYGSPMNENAPALGPEGLWPAGMKESVSL